MSQFPLLPPNSALEISPAPTDPVFGEIASRIHRLAGTRDPLDMAMLCLAEAFGSVSQVGDPRRQSARFAHLKWATEHASQWIRLAEREAARAPLQQAAE